MINPVVWRRAGRKRKFVHESPVRRPDPGCLSICFGSSTCLRFQRRWDISKVSVKQKPATESVCLTFRLQPDVLTSESPESRVDSGQAAVLNLIVIRIQVESHFNCECHFLTSLEFGHPLRRVFSYFLHLLQKPSRS